MADESNSGRKRGTRIPVTMTEREKKAIRIAAAIEGVNMSDFIRERVLPDARDIAGSALDRGHRKAIDS